MVADFTTWLGAQEPDTLVIYAVVILVLGYLVSLKLHPWRPCLRCKGKPRHQGAIYSYAWRNCGRCGGGGRELRRGVRIVGIGKPKQT